MRLRKVFAYSGKWGMYNSGVVGLLDALLLSPMPELSQHKDKLLLLSINLCCDIAKKIPSFPGSME